MRRTGKRGAIVLSAMVSVGVLLVGPAQFVSATGNCSTGYVTFFAEQNPGLGASNQFCYGVNDSNIESEPGAVMGPLYNGSYANDFDNANLTSGASSYAYYDAAGGPNIKLCLYQDSNYGRFFRPDDLSFTGTFGPGYDNVVGSFKFVLVGQSCVPL